jgi:phosphoribosylaminoimidazolecarboxamide formyltransferase/IMP cyclohydrolase
MSSARADCSFDDAVENIDIGGPTMVRAAAKNWQRVAVIVDPADYAALGEALAASGRVLPEPLRRRLARKAFAHTAAYDAAIATYLAGLRRRGRRRRSRVVARRCSSSASPPARCATARTRTSRPASTPTHPPGDPPGLDRAACHQGKALSYNNLLDADAALGLVRDLARLGPAAAIIKHVSPCGLAVGRAGQSIAMCTCAPAKPTPRARSAASSRCQRGRSTTRW